MTLDGRLRINVKPGVFVKVQEKLKKDSSLIPGIIKKVVTKSPFHELGIMVILENNIEGRVKEIVEDISRLDVYEKTPFELINLLEIKLRELIVKCIRTKENWWKTLPQDVYLRS